jgi:hypothetical protein
MDEIPFFVRGIIDWQMTRCKKVVRFFFLKKIKINKIIKKLERKGE